MKNHDEGLELINLISVTGNYELAVIEGILDDNNIPFVLNDRGSGSAMRLYFGGSIFGSDILVSKRDYEKAKDLIEGISFDDIESGQLEDIDDSDEYDIEE